MRSIRIAFENNEVLPSETLAGQVIIKTSKSFVCTGILLKLRSTEMTE